jgi:uncharacterized protein YrzB (UPF0473 family)
MRRITALSLAAATSKTLEWLPDMHKAFTTVTSNSPTLTDKRMDILEVKPNARQQRNEQSVVRAIELQKIQKTNKNIQIKQQCDETNRQGQDVQQHLFFIEWDRKWRVVSSVTLQYVLKTRCSLEAN